MRPEVGSASPAIRLKMVDLPQPVLPSTATISPRVTWKEMRSTAVKRPEPSGRSNVLVTFSKVMAMLSLRRHQIVRSDRGRQRSAQASIAVIRPWNTSTNTTSCSVQASAPAMSNSCCWRSNS